MLISMHNVKIISLKVVRHHFSCGQDLHLVQTPVYSEDLRVAVRESHVFKYADRAVLEFQCQVTVCIKYNGGCDGITVSC